MGSLPEFGRFTNGSEVAATFADRLRGKNVIVTGGNPTGLGGSTARVVAAQKPGVLIITYRSESQVKDFIPELKAISPETNVVGLLLDLSDLQSVRSAAEEVNKSFDHIDILINNAGVMSIQTRELTNYGTEVQFGVNHIGHFLFTNLILGKLLTAAETNAPNDTRVVNLTGGWHHFGPVRFDDLNWDGKPVPPEQEPNKVALAKFGCQTEGTYLPEAAYAQSKTANILFSVSLTEKLKKKGIVSYSVNPGGILTEIGRHIPAPRAEELIASGLLDKNPDQGVSSTLYAAIDPRVQSEGSPYIDDCKQIPASSFATDPVLAEKLWKLSEEIVGQKFEL